jgi:hypothetical protein
MEPRGAHFGTVIFRDKRIAELRRKRNAARDVFDLAQHDG